MNPEQYMTHAEKMFNQREAQIGHLPGHILRDLARNPGAPLEWRKAAVELMLDKGYPEVSHPDLSALLADVQAHKHAVEVHQEAKIEVQSLVESQIEAPLDEAPKPPKPAKPPKPPKETPGPFKASFTTTSQTQDELVG